MAKGAANTSRDLEKRVANAYRRLGARKVERDVVLAGNRIDVYVELETPGRLLHRIAVEVKDLKRTVGIDIVNNFARIADLLRGKQLIDEGVIVSAEGFSEQARNAAKEHGLRLLKSADLEAMVGGLTPKSVLPEEPDSTNKPKEEMEEPETGPESEEPEAFRVKASTWWASLDGREKVAYIGLASAVLVAFIGLCGALGQPLVENWSVAMVATRTPTSTPTHTATPTSTPIPTQSPTPAPTFTPTPSPTPTSPSPTLTPTPPPVIVPLGDLAVPSCWMSGTPSPPNYIDVEEVSSGCYSDSHCLRIEYRTGGNWAGILWQPVGCGGACVSSPYTCAIDLLATGNLSMVDRLTFWAKGAQGGERVEFVVGSGSAGPPPNLRRSTGTVTLLPAWEDYEIDLSGVDLTDSVALFYWGASDANNPDGAAFYLDDIQFEGLR